MLLATRKGHFHGKIMHMILNIKYGREKTKRKTASNFHSLAVSYIFRFSLTSCELRKLTEKQVNKKITFFQS